MFEFGARVVCVDMTPREDGLEPRYPGTVLPVLGGVYTVRDIFDAAPYGYDEPALLLAEVVNRVRSYFCKNGRLVAVGQFWLAFRLRPVRTTNIDVFTAMLEPVPLVFRPIHKIPEIPAPSVSASQLLLRFRAGRWVPNERVRTLASAELVDA